MQVYQVTQNYKANPSFQKLDINVASQLMSMAVRRVLLPTEKEIVSPIILRAMKDDITFLEHDNKLYLAVRSGRGKRKIYVDDYLKPNGDSFYEFADRIKVKLGELFDRISKNRQLAKDAKKLGLAH